MEEILPPGSPIGGQTVDGLQHPGRRTAEGEGDRAALAAPLHVHASAAVLAAAQHRLPPLLLRLQKRFFAFLNLEKKKNSS